MKNKKKKLLDQNVSKKKTFLIKKSVIKTFLKIYKFFKNLILFQVGVYK